MAAKRIFSHEKSLDLWLLSGSILIFEKIPIFSTRFFLFPRNLITAALVVPVQKPGIDVPFCSSGVVYMWLSRRTRRTRRWDRHRLVVV